MRRALWLSLIVAAGVVVLTLGACTGSGAWTTVFMVEPDELASTGRSPGTGLLPRSRGRRRPADHHRPERD